jgi:subtilisin family serine protease
MGSKLASWLVLVILLAFFPNADTDSPEPARDMYLCVEAGARQLEAMGIHTDEDYSGFVTLWTSPADRRALENSGLSFFSVEGMDDVFLPGASFSLSQKDFAKKGLEAFGEAGQDQFYVIVKLKGPEKTRWLDELEATGARVVGGPLSHFDLIVRAERQQLKDISMLPFVRWIGNLEPSYKLPFQLPSSGDVEFDMVFFREAPADFTRAIEMVKASGGSVLELDTATEWWNSAIVRAPVQTARSILRIPGLWTLEVAQETGPRNDVARWVLQSFGAATLATPYWSEGITGEGVIVGLADSGIDYDHIAFRTTMDDQGIPGPSHRKIVRYNTSIDDWDVVGHGTHVAGSLAGDSLITPNGYNKYDGLAFGARIAFYDIVDANGGWEPPTIREILGDAYDAGARSHSDSWGDSNSLYTLRAQRIDQFQWDHPDFLTFVAAGNIGPGAGTVLEPATAKNIVAVGNAINGNTTDLNQGSSHGPTQQGLIAPTLVAPGTSIMSAMSDSTPKTYNTDYKSMTGTSMATPLAAASGALVEQYFREGFYPGGKRGSGPGFLPSGPLRKAVLVASAWDQSGGKNIGGAPPDFGQGWGKILLSNALYLAGNERTRELWVEDNYNDSHANDGLATGQTWTEQMAVNSSLPLKIILTWNDWPGAGLVNDLNLVVTAPNGTVYRGNQMVNGGSVASNKADSTNTVEAVMLNDPARGLYTVNVTAFRVGNGDRQRYALAATGDLHDPGVAVLHLDRDRTAPNSTLNITLSDSGLRGAGSVKVNAISTSESSPEQLTLHEVGSDGLFEGSLAVHSGTPEHNGMVEVQDGDRVRVHYYDPDPPGTAWDDALVDGSPPRVMKWTLENITDSTAYISVETDEPSTLSVTYWNKTPSMEMTDPVMSFKHGIEIRGLLPRTGYLADLVLGDLCGNGRMFDLDGRHLGFRTHDMTLRPRPGFAGYAIDAADGNRFGEESMSAGISGGAGRLAGVRFDAQAFPSQTRVAWAQLRLVVKNTDPAISTSTWTVEMMAANASSIIDPSRSEPMYGILLGGSTEGALGNVFGLPDMPAGRWQYFNLTTAQSSVLYQDLLEGRVAFRIKGPVSGDDSYAEWYTGASTRTSFLAPQLVLDLDYPPEVLPGAIIAFSMEEDTVDVTHVNMTRVFWDLDGDVLKYGTQNNPDGSGANITVVAAGTGAVSFQPRQNWNGAVRVRFLATDQFGLSVAHDVNVTVEPENDPVRLSTINGTPAVDGMRFTARQDETMVLNVGVEDADLDMEGDSFRYSTNDSLIRFTSTKSGVISFSPGNMDIGVRNVRISVRDSDSECSINVTFDIVNVNDPPEAYIESPLTGELFDNQTLVRFSAFGSGDPDTIWGDVLNFSWESNLTGIIGHGIELNATLEPGNHSILLTIMDNFGAFCQTSVELSIEAVLPPPPPPPPPPLPPASPTRTNEMFYRLVAVTILILSLILCWLLVIPRRPSNRPSPATEPADSETAATEEEPEENVPDADDNIVDVEAYKEP